MRIRLLVLLVATLLGAVWGDTEASPMSTAVVNASLGGDETIASNATVRTTPAVAAETVTGSSTESSVLGDPGATGDESASISQLDLNETTYTHDTLTVNANQALRDAAIDVSDTQHNTNDAVINAAINATLNATLNHTHNKTANPKNTFLSFNEWREKHLAQNTSNNFSGAAANVTSSRREWEQNNVSTGNKAVANVTDPVTLPSETSAVVYQEPLPDVGSGKETDPLLMLSGRSNYALSDCTASVHRSSQGIKNAGNILTEKKDRYLLVACEESNKSVEIELCDEIRIDHIVLANFEFFSSNFKEFSIKVSRVYPAKASDWDSLGVFRARNARGIQVFVPDYSTNSPDFYRYLRIDFQSHYGSEYYCPISLLRVYGETHMDAYRHLELGYDEDPPETSEGEGVISVEEERPVEVNSVQETYKGEDSCDEATNNSYQEQLDSLMNDTLSALIISATLTDESLLSLPTEDAGTNSVLFERVVNTSAAAHNSTNGTSGKIDPSDSPELSVGENATSAIEDEKGPGATILASEEHASTILAPSGTETGASATENLLSGTQGVIETPVATVTNSTPGTAENSARIAINTPEDIAKTSENTVKTTEHVPKVPENAAKTNDIKSTNAYGRVPPVQPGESIYGTIMKRILNLERNQSIVLSYMEQQGEMIKSVLSDFDQRFSASELDMTAVSAAVTELTLSMAQLHSEAAHDRAVLVDRVNRMSVGFFIMGLTEAVALIFLFVFVFSQKGPSMLLPAVKTKKKQYSLGDEPVRSRRLVSPLQRASGHKLYRMQSNASSSMSSLSLRRAEADDWVDEDIRSSLRIRPSSARSDRSLMVTATAAMSGRQTPPPLDITNTITPGDRTSSKTWNDSPLSTKQSSKGPFSFASKPFFLSPRAGRMNKAADKMTRIYSDPSVKTYKKATQQGPARLGRWAFDPFKEQTTEQSGESDAASAVHES